MDRAAKLEKEIAKEQNPTKERQRIHNLARSQIKLEAAFVRIAPDMQAARELLNRL